MAGIQPPAEKGRQRLLLEPGHGGGRKAQPLLIHRQQPPGQHQIGHADRGGDGPGEGAHIDHLSPIIQTLHGGDGTAQVAELAVVVVLHQKTLLPLLRPGQQRRPAAHRHGAAHGELVGWGDIGHRGPALPQLVRPQAAVIQRDHADLPSVVAQHLPGRQIARVFQTVNAVLRQHLHQHIEQVFQSRPHHDLVGIAADAPVFPEELRQRPAEGRVAPGLAPLQKLGVAGHHFPAETRPGGIGEHPGVHRAGGKIVPHGLSGGGGGKLLGRGLLAHGAVQGGADVIAAFGSGPDVALGSQHTVGVLHRALADVQVGADRPLGRQLFPGLQPPGLDLPHDVAVQLVIQGLFAVGLQLDGEVFHK